MRDRHDLTNAARPGTLRAGLMRRTTPPHTAPPHTPAHPPRYRPDKAFALRPSRLVPWGSIGDSTLDCVIIGTHRLALAREDVHGGVA
ncbi:hypothetical protein GCM10010320_66250 [Streptomyces caelestis]|nr:hypothetical protein GCM10010320_66250 [Streptomyces caelestis]